MNIIYTGQRSVIWIPSTSILEKDQSSEQKVYWKKTSRLNTKYTGILVYRLHIITKRQKSHLRCIQSKLSQSIRNKWGKSEAFTNHARKASSILPHCYSTAPNANSHAMFTPPHPHMCTCTHFVWTGQINNLNVCTRNTKYYASIIQPTVKRLIY